jgi:hypothetical protein
MEKISCTNLVRNKVLLRVKEDRSILHTIKRMVTWIGRILCRNCLLKQVIEGKIEGRIVVMGRWGRRHEQLLDEYKEKREYWGSKDEALNFSLWKASFGKGYGPVIIQATE